MVLHKSIRLTEATEIKEVALEAATALAEAKGKDIVIIDFDGKSSYTDYFIIANGDSQVHMKALANRVNEALTNHRLKQNRAEGQGSKNWILLDYNSIIVHIFSKQARDYYAIDQLWGDAKVIPWSDEREKSVREDKRENGTWH